MSWSRIQKIAALGLGGAVSGYFVLRNRDLETNCSWTSNYTVGICGIWDKNWDHRDPGNL